MVKVKKHIEDICDELIIDDALKNGMKSLIIFSRDIKMNPRHAWGNAFSCFYKSKKVANYNLRDGNIFITIYIADKDDLENILLKQPDGQELITEIMNRNATHCEGCNPNKINSCESAIKLNSTGGKYNFFCSRFNYNCYNPTPEQFEVIKRIIEIRRSYIDERK
jgi:hypothetical protein